MKNVKAIIYDCDGVLVNSVRANEAYYNHILSHFGFPPLKPSDMALVQTGTARDIIDALFKGTGLTDEAQSFQTSLINDAFSSLIDVEPGVRKVLTQLRRDYRTALVTNRGKSLPALLTRHRLDNLFDFIVCGLDVKKAKPHPEGLFIVLDHFGVSAHDAVYIGDSEVDRQLCEEVAVTFIAYKNKNVHAAYRLEKHSDLPKLLARAVQDE